jgi:hypothetical protein
MKAGTDSKLKFAGLKRQLKLPFWQVVGVLEAIWHVALRNAPAGDVGRLTNEEIASAIEWDGDADELIAALVKSRWLDTDPEYRLIIHDWSEHCPNYLKGGYTNGHKKFADVAARERASVAITPGAKLPSLDGELSSVAKLPSQAGASEGVATNSIQFNPSQSNGCNEVAKRPSLPQVDIPEDTSKTIYPWFPCIAGKANGERSWFLSGEFLAELKAAFPGVDANVECRRAHVWVMSNLPKRKTADGMKAFLFTWMTRAQNKSGHSGDRTKPPPVPPPPNEPVPRRIPPVNWRNASAP